MIAEPVHDTVSIAVREATDRLADRAAPAPEGLDSVVIELPIEPHAVQARTTLRGIARIAYVPDGWTAPLDGFSRALELLAEGRPSYSRLAAELAETVEAALEPLGAGVVIEAEVGEANSRSVATATTGCYAENRALWREVILWTLRRRYRPPHSRR